MCLPSLLIGFGSLPNVQSVPRNNYIPEESRMNFVADFDGCSFYFPWKTSRVKETVSGTSRCRCQNVGFDGSGGNWQGCRILAHIWALRNLRFAFVANLFKFNPNFSVKSKEKFHVSEFLEVWQRRKCGEFYLQNKKNDPLRWRNSQFSQIWKKKATKTNDLRWFHDFEKT